MFNRVNFVVERVDEDVCMETIYTSSSLKYKLVETDRRHAKTILQVFFALVADTKSPSEKFIHLFKTFR